MTTLRNNYDSIGQMIFDEGLKIEAVDFHTELDVMLIILNTKAVLQQKISSFNNLRSAEHEALRNCIITANGTGINWPILDEDLSLKGFLRDELKTIVINHDYLAV